MYFVFALLLVIYSSLILVIYLYYFYLHVCMIVYLHTCMQVPTEAVVTVCMGHLCGYWE